MPAITLPDGSVRRFDGPVTGTTVAAAIGPGLAKAALAMKLDGTLMDLSREIDHDASVVFVTRHSDFQARAKSTLHGAQDLIAKPFLAFELALKALTLILRTRLAGRPSAAQAARAAATPPPVASAAENTPAPVAPTQPAEAVPAVATTSASAPTAEPAAAAKAAPQPAPALAPAPDRRRHRRGSVRGGRAPVA